MAIKPKSRAHEDRIKALEEYVAELRARNIVRVEMPPPEEMQRRINACLPKTRPWYKRIFGL